MTTVTSLLDTLSGPADLKSVPESALPGLAAEIRERLIETVTRAGGHLGPNLGVVELTLALHRVFDSPRDLIVWDTGHQAYVHKMLTGRADGFSHLRQAGGLSGYPNRSESAHDLVENSHASTALSYADGLAKAMEHRGETARRVVAVVGDGSLTGGLAWEALNNIGDGHRPVVVVLNDNGRSYAPTVGAVAAHLGRLRTARGRSANAGASPDPMPVPMPVPVEVRRRLSSLGCPRSRCPTSRCPHKGCPTSRCPSRRSSSTRRCSSSWASPTWARWTATT